MSGTAVATLPAQLPAFLQRQDLVQAAQQFNTSALGGIKAGGFPRLSLAGGRFYILDNSAENPRQIITLQDAATGAWVPASYISVVVVGANPNLSKTFYEGAFVPGEDKEPDCSSDDGQFPDPHILNPVSQACATCPMNAWGSKRTPEGKETKACSDSKRLVVIPAAGLKDFKALALQVTPAALKEWGTFVRTLDRSGQSIPVFAVVVRLAFDINVTFPKLTFTFERLLSEEEFAIVQQRMASDEVKNIEKPSRAPRTTTPALPALPAPAAPAAEPQQAQAAPPVAPANPTLQAAQVSFGPAPVATSPAVPAAPTPSILVTPSDPLAGLSPETIAAVNAMGGPTTPVAQQIIAAARAVAAQGIAPQVQAAAPVPAEAPKRRGRPAKAQEPAATPAAPAVSFGPAPAPAQPAAPTVPVAPAGNPAGGFASSPAAVVVQGGGVASELDALLAGVMGGATP